MSRSLDEAAAENGGLDLRGLRAELAPRAILLTARRIAPGDEDAFSEGVAASPGGLARARASGAARIAARSLLANLGADPQAPLARLPSRAVLWPPGFVGSLAHDGAYAVAAVAPRAKVPALGVDIEPAEPLPADVFDFALTPAERADIADAVQARLVFCCKEAVYKAIHPLDGTPLEYEDIETRLSAGLAVLRDGRRVSLAFSVTAEIVAVAYVSG